MPRTSRKTGYAYKPARIYVGIDGEGQGRVVHKYTLLCMSDKTGKRMAAIRNPEGLSTDDCLKFITSAPKSWTPFAYAFGYDITKILADLPDEQLFLLVHPELRQRTGPKAMLGPKPVYWNGYELNLQGTKLTAARSKLDNTGGRKVIVWDIFKFFGSKFVSAIKDWKVGEKRSWDLMTKMKERRSEFGPGEEDAILRYCQEECRYMAELADKLTTAHVNVGLKLTGYYGAGSSASAMLKVMGIKDAIVPPPEGMKEAIASAFFGGRFENSMIGTVNEPVWNYDISSAYPYQLCFLPCLLHGHWVKAASEREMRARARPAGPGPRPSG